MARLSLMVILGSVCLVCCLAQSRVNKTPKELDSKYYELLKEVFAQLEALDRRLVAVEENCRKENRQESKYGRKGEKVKQNGTTEDLEDRVSDLELGLAAVADNLDELQESQNTQDEKLLVIDKQLLAVNGDIDQLEDASFDAHERIDSLEITDVLHGEQINVIEQTTSLLQEKVNVLENTDTETLETLNELENADEQLEQRMADIESMVGNMTVDTELTERVEALERADEIIDKRVDDLERFVNVTDLDDLNERVTDLEDADDELDARIDRIEDETGAGEGSANDSLPICYGGYQTLNETFRRVGETGSNDDTIIYGTWYRINLPSGENGLLDICPRSQSCGTNGAIWITSAHPKVIGEIQKSFAHASLGGNCEWSGPLEEIQITKCYVAGERFYLYKLLDPRCYPCAYCVRRYDNI